MAFKIDRRNGQNYAENIIDPLLLFDEGTWVTASGTGTASLNTTYNFVGDSSLKIENNVPASDYIVTNSVQSTFIPAPNDYQLSWYVRKDIALEEREGAVLIYKNASLLDTQTFTIGSTDADLDNNDVWVRFQSDTIYSLTKNDIITFQFKVTGVTTTELTTFFYVDGLMLNLGERGNVVAPLYSKPVSSLTGIQLFGSYNYQDDGTSSVTTAAIDTWYNVVNNGGGALTTNIGGYNDVTPYNITNNNFDLYDLSLYDDLEIRLDLKVTTVSTNQEVSFRLNIANDLAFLNVFNKEYDVAVTDRQETIYMSVNVLTELSRTDGFRLECMSNKVGAVITVNGYYVKVNKRNV
jgi:hypothetical protein